MAAKKEQHEPHDRLTSSIQFTANKQLTQKQWEKLLEKLQEQIENMILEDDKLREQIGHVLIGTPYSQECLEICV